MVGPVTDWLLAIGMWTVVLWRIAVARTGSELMWACAAVAVVATLQIDTVRQAIDRGGAQPELSTLASHLVASAAAGLLATWQLALSGPLDRVRRTRSMLGGGFVLVAVALVVTWFASSAHTGTVHSVVFCSWLGTMLVVFLRSARARVGVLPAGDTRQALCLLMASAVGLLAWATAGAAEHVAGVNWRALRLPDPRILLAPTTALFLVAVCWTLIGRDRLRYDAEAIPRDLADLWRWLRGPGGLDQPPKDLMELVVEIRDLIWHLQRHVPRTYVPEALRAARRQGLGSVRARAFAAAICLELGLVARTAAADAVHPADLSELGGGVSPQQEACWLAGVWRATGPAASIAANQVLAALAPDAVRHV